MVALYLASSETGSGKTALAAGLGKHWRDNGRKVGFFKPVLAKGKHQTGKAPDNDVSFIKNLFALEESVELLSPVINNDSNLKSQIKEAYARVSAGKDVVIIEGIAGQGQKSAVVEALNARVVIVESYSGELPGLRKAEFGRNLLGVVVNKVPANRLERLRARLADQLSQSGLTVLGILPEERNLMAPTIAGLVERIQGEFLTGAEKAEELVENLMLGGKVVDHGPNYFGRKANKAVVVRSERPDMQLAALETSTRCLVLTGNYAPMAAVLRRAAEKKVPIILARDNITTVAENVERAIGQSRLDEGDKLPGISRMMEQHFDFATVDKALV